MADDQNLNPDGGRKVVTTSGEFTKGTPEERFLISLRPTRFEDYVGQKNTVGSLKIATQAARKRGEVLDHVLLHGPPGLGKTTLATIISREMDSKIVNTSGPALERTADVVGLLSNLEQGDIFFIDEIHRLARSVEEYLYSAMEDFRVDFMTGSGAFARTISLPLQQFTLIGSTTRAGMLSAPLRDRFGLQYHLDFYSQEDLVKVIKTLRLHHKVHHRRRRHQRDCAARPWYATHRQPPPSPGTRLRRSQIRRTGRSRHRH